MVKTRREERLGFGQFSAQLVPWASQPAPHVALDLEKNTTDCLQSTSSSSLCFSQHLLLFLFFSVQTRTWLLQASKRSSRRTWSWTAVVWICGCLRLLSKAPVIWWSDSTPLIDKPAIWLLVRWHLTTGCLKWWTRTTVIRHQVGMKRNLRWFWCSDRCYCTSLLCPVVRKVDDANHWITRLIS